jgi:hypothetical protein
VASGKDLDFPVIVWARALYAYSILGKNLSHLNDVTNYSVEKFLEKINYADAESISLVLFSLARFGKYDSNTWTQLLNALEHKQFRPEFTVVKSKEPFVYRYEEVDNSSKFLDDFCNPVFEKGYKAIYETLYALRHLSQNSNDLKDRANENIRMLEQRFPLVLSNFETFNKLI